MLQRNTQKFLAAKSKVEGLNVSGETKEEIHARVMQLYRRMAGEDGADVFQFAPDFKFVAAAECLEAQPKFSQTYCGTTATANAYRDSNLTLSKKRKDIERCFSNVQWKSERIPPYWGEKQK